MRITADIKSILDRLHSIAICSHHDYIAVTRDDILNVIQDIESYDDIISQALANAESDGFVKGITACRAALTEILEEDTRDKRAFEHKFLSELEMMEK